MDTCQSHDNCMKEIKDDLQSIKKLLVGNGAIGVAEMARRSFEYMEKTKQTRNGLLDWAFRAMITIVVGYIAMKVGVK